MKKYPLIFFLVISVFAANAQFNVYHQFPDSNAYWSEFVDVTAIPVDYCEGYGYTLIGDTIVGGMKHCKLFQVGGYYANNCLGGTTSQTIGFYGAIREDTMKHVYLCCTTKLGAK